MLAVFEVSGLFEALDIALPEVVFMLIGPLVAAPLLVKFVLLEELTVAPVLEALLVCGAPKEGLYSPALELDTILGEIDLFSSVDWFSVPNA